MTEQTLPKEKRKRKPDGEILLFEGALVNRQGLARILGVPPLRISLWTRLPNGLPFIRQPSGDPGRRGLRLLFNVAQARQWLEGFAEYPNPPRQNSRQGPSGPAQHQSKSR